MLKLLGGAFDFRTALRLRRALSQIGLIHHDRIVQQLTTNMRREHDRIDRCLADWTRARSRDELVQELADLGIPAAPVLNASEVFSHPQLQAREFFQFLERAHVGTQPNPLPPYRVNGTAPPVRAPAPTLGQHTRQVLESVLDLAADELDALERDGIIGTEPLARSS